MIEYLLLGIVQGITEWLPISSKGQVTLAGTAMGMKPGAALDLAIFMHIGTVLAAVIYFRNDLKGLFKREKRYLLRFVFISTLFAGLVGGPLYLFVVQPIFGSSDSAGAGDASGEAGGISGVAATAFIGAMLVVTGLIQRQVKPKGRKEETVKAKDSVITGALQGLAAIPGISRVGITSSALLFRGFSSEAALRLSFMMSIFAVTAAEIGLHVRGGFVVSDGALASMGAAFVVGLAAISILMRVAHKVKFWKFLIVLGVMSMAPLAYYLL